MTNDDLRNKGGRRSLGGVVKSSFVLIILFILTVGTLWPSGMNLLLPAYLHYEKWHVSLKIIGWTVVALVIIWDFISTIYNDKNNNQ